MYGAGEQVSAGIGRQALGTEMGSNWGLGVRGLLEFVLAWGEMPGAGMGHAAGSGYPGMGRWHCQRLGQDRH